MRARKQNSNVLNNRIYGYLRAQLYNNIEYSLFYVIDYDLYKLSIEDVNDLVYYHIRESNEEA